MEMFKINNKVKREIAREVKEVINGKEYTEIGIMYNVDKENFFTVETSKIDRFEHEGNIKYKVFIHYGADGKLTLKDIEEKIFTGKEI